MVSLWPWKGNDNSPASFEKTLSALSSKISKSQLQLDSLRQRQRRLKVLWTLYSSFAYILCAVALGVVVGWRSWSVWEYTAVAGRTGIRVYYTYRIDNVTRRLDEYQTERANTIDKLKLATKYNSTQQLLEKYGGAPSSPKPKASPVKTATKKAGTQIQRTTTGPPATANIPRNHAQSPSPQAPISLPTTPQPMMTHPGPTMGQPGPPEFAPNAFSGAAQYDRGGETVGGGNWYDRIMDLLLGEDETSPKNRMVLICKHCRLVNGQAPPGIKRLEDLGKWRCNACGGWNGEVDEGTKLVAEITEMQAIDHPEDVQTKEATKPLEHELVNSDEVVVDDAEMASEDEDSEPAAKPVKAKRGRPKKA